MNKHAKKENLPKISNHHHQRNTVAQCDLLQILHFFVFFCCWGETIYVYCKLSNEWLDGIIGNVCLKFCAPRMERCAYEKWLAELF